MALVGGDTTASRSGITINVTAIGRVRDDRIKRRSDARPGDTILVGGALGESAAGLRDLLDGRCGTPLAAVHRNPVPQVEEGCWLSARPEVRAMMDLSDGLASDLRHIMERSGVGAEIDLERIPTPVDLRTALCGGEDYKLLLTADTAHVPALLADFRAHFGTALHPVGRITGSRSLVWLDRGTPQPLDWQGFRHY